MKRSMKWIQYAVNNVSVRNKHRHRKTINLSPYSSSYRITIPVHVNMANKPLHFLPIKWISLADPQESHLLVFLNLKCIELVGMMGIVRFMDARLVWVEFIRRVSMERLILYNSVPFLSVSLGSASSLDQTMTRSLGSRGSLCDEAADDCDNINVVVRWVFRHVSSCIFVACSWHECFVSSRSSVFTRPFDAWFVR